MMYDLIQNAINQALSNLHTCLPGRIESYNHQEQSASVKPLINRRLRTSDGGFEVEELAVIPNVPVQWPRSGGASLTFPVNRGDTCLLVFAERSLDKWTDEGGIVTPEDGRKHALKDAIAIMGVQPFVGGNYPSDNNNVRLMYNKGQVVLNNDNKIAIGNDKAELLDLFEQTLTALINSTTATSIGAQPLSVVPDLQNIKTLLAEIKGAL